MKKIIALITILLLLITISVAGCTTNGTPTKTATTEKQVMTEGKPYLTDTGECFVYISETAGTRECTPDENAVAYTAAAK